MTPEVTLEYTGKDELPDVTPVSVRLRKKLLYREMCK
jgi:predicted membrane GTPase involved in stress response